MLLNFLAKILAKPAVADYIIKRASRTKYFDLPGYMERNWVFNGYGDDHVRPHKWLPISGRHHHILREDLDEHPHDHPVDARTFILRGWYIEERDDGFHYRIPGDTATIKFGEFHKIVAVSPGGVHTLFVLGRTRGEWGFRVNGQKVPYREYLGLDHRKAR